MHSLRVVPSWGAAASVTTALETLVCCQPARTSVLFELLRWRHHTANVASSLGSSGAAAATARLCSTGAAAAAPQQPAQQPRRSLPKDGRSLGDFLLGNQPILTSDTRDAAGAAGSQSQCGQQQQHKGTGLSQPSPHAVHIETYGCQMNVADSQIVSSVLAEHSYTAAVSLESAGVVLLNTCAIRENAEARIWGRLGELQALKRARRSAKQPPLIVGVLGCMAERLKERLLDRERLADLVVGPDAYKDLPRILAAVQAGAAQGSAAINVQLSLEETYADVMPVRPDSSVRHAFVSIMRGCDNMCAFCIVPFTRGRERSRPADSILREVETLAAQGVREVTLLGQNVNSYADRSAPTPGGATGPSAAAAAGPGSSVRDGGDRFAAYAPGFTSVYVPRRDGSLGFAQLLDRVASVDPGMRVRFTSPHPKDFTDDVLGVIASHPNICRQLHMPAQSGSSEVLARMRRGYGREAYDALVGRARAALPHVALSTDIITGFCGETDAEHAATLDLLSSTRFDSAFLFSYSERAKTHAARHLPDDVPQDVKAARLAAAFGAYRAGQAELNALEPGRMHLVLLDGRPRRSNAAALQGRTCSFKRAIMQEPIAGLPASLTALRDAWMPVASGQATVQGGSQPPPPPLPPPQHQRLLLRPPGAAVSGGQGPTVEVGTGDYVAVLVQAVVGTATLLTVPLARTSVTEFAALLGGTIVARGDVPEWARAAGAAAADAAGGGWAHVVGQSGLNGEEPLLHAAEA